MKTFREHIVESVIVEASGAKSLHDSLVKEHGFTHKSVYPMGFSKSYQAMGMKGDDHCHTDEKVTPKYVHDVMIEHGYTHLTKSKADSRVSLPVHTHYEKEQMGSRQSVHVIHGSDGIVDHIKTKRHVVRD